ncbi:hypothetical protein [Acidimangrovimonas sediminis]|uniref:hypothetical protein n=1 Tax=Acidimangrovimonas sediminis TaxID=2056283 RepID=UPI000C7F9A1B|nr:hypothetical protein [Acidimangrovimonas sediminis]
MPDADDRLVVSPKLPSDDPARRRLTQVLDAPAKPTRRLLARLQRGYGMLRHSAGLHAKQELDARASTVERAETALHGLRRAMLKALPVKLRSQFTGAIMREASEADRSMKALRRTANAGHEENDR